MIKKKPPEKKRPVGRPTKYKPEYCQKMIDYFNIDPIHYETLETGVKRESKMGPVLPTFERFAHNLDVSRDTLTEWRDVHEEFSLSYERCKQLMENVWKINALRGTYNAGFSVFLGKNVFGYKDKSEVDQNTTVTVMPTIKINGKELKFNVGEDVE